MAEWVILIIVILVGIAVFIYIMLCLANSLTEIDLNPGEHKCPDCKQIIYIHPGFGNRISTN